MDDHSDSYDVCVVERMTQGVGLTPHSFAVKARSGTARGLADPAELQAHLRSRTRSTHVQLAPRARDRSSSWWPSGGPRSGTLEQSYREKTDPAVLDIDAKLRRVVIVSQLQPADREPVSFRRTPRLRLVREHAAATGEEVERTAVGVYVDHSAGLRPPNRSVGDHMTEVTPIAFGTSNTTHPDADFPRDSWKDP